MSVYKDNLYVDCFGHGHFLNCISFFIYCFFSLQIWGAWNLGANIYGFRKRNDARNCPELSLEFDRPTLIARDYIINLELDQIWVRVDESFCSS
jgi:hypothetical protein